MSLALLANVQNQAAEFWGGLNDLARRYAAKPEEQRQLVFAWQGGRLVSDALNAELSSKAIGRQAREAENRKQFNQDIKEKEREQCEQRNLEHFEGMCW